MSEFLAHVPGNSDRKYFHKLPHRLKKTGIRASRFGRNEMEKKMGQDFDIGWDDQLFY